MKTLKDLTIEDVQALNDCIHGNEGVGDFVVHTDGIRVLGVSTHYTIRLSEKGRATAEFGVANPVEAGLDFYVEMKRRGFAVPALDGVYGEQLQQRDERITELESELETADDDIAQLEEYIRELLSSPNF